MNKSDYSVEGLDALQQQIDEYFTIDCAICKLPTPIGHPLSTEICDCCKQSEGPVRVEAYSRETIDTEFKGVYTVKDAIRRFGAPAHVSENFKTGQLTFVYC